MPEGPEILLSTQYLLSKIRKRYITKVSIISGKYIKKPIPGFALLEGRFRIEDISCKGKFMWMTLTSDNTLVYLMSSFGMTGSWEFQQNNYTRLVFELDNGTKNNKTYKLYYNDQRNFGNIGVTDNLAVLEKKINSLGLDLIQSNLTQNEMVAHLTQEIKNMKNTKRNHNIVTVLMSQEINKGIGSGIGNYLCSEILYDAKISPHKNITDLSTSEIKSLALSIRTIMKRAFVNNTTVYTGRTAKFATSMHEKIKSGKFTNYYPDIKLDNTKFVYKVYQQKTDPLGNPVIAEKIHSDRTTWWVKNIQ
jgi:formamidopyrimidine-DNA glycosylase